MSSFILIGFFALTGGRRVRFDVARPNGSPVTICHMLYNTSVICSREPGELSAEVRKYSPVGEAPLPDNTVAFMVAKAFVPNEESS
ncbi:hypothetical protein DFH94DRAFT_655147, partial [Russula ochroleuca]